jgi:osmoprotectant transport system substrate-binding protein
MVSRARQRCLGVAAVIAAAVSLSACGSSGTPSTTTAAPVSAPRPGAGKPTVTLGTKNFTEELILGQLYVQALRARGFAVALKSNIGSSEVVDRELASRRIDGYPEYTGTILSVLAHDSRRPASAGQAYTRAASFERRRGSELLGMASAEDTDVLITKPAYASRAGLRSLGDLRKLGSLVTVAAAPEFRNRFNGLVGLRAVYGLSALRVRPVRIGTQYRALDSGRAQLAAAFTTDGNLSQGGYTLLQDPQNIFGFQNVTFVVRRDILARQGPAFAPTINAVTRKLSTQALRVMNAAVDLDGQSPAAVARQFLGANGLL